MRRTLAILLILFLIVPVPGSAQLSILGLKNSLVDFALEQLSVPGELEITADGVEEPEDGVTSLVGLRVADGDGVWLEVAEVALNWNASRLLSGELEITRLAATDVKVLRAPSGGAPEVKEDEEEDEGFALEWPRAPLTLRVDEMRLDGVDIAAGVIAEQGLAFDASGRLVDEGDEQSLALNVTRTDAVPGQIGLDYVRGFEGNTLRLNLSADEAAGGLVAEILGLPAGSASRVAIEADGPLSDWSLSLSAEAEQILSATGALVVDLVDAIEVDARLGLVPGDALDQGLRTVLAPRADLVLRVAEDDSGVIRIEEGRIASPALTAAADGSYEREGERADLRLTLLGAPELAGLVEGFDFDGLGFEGTVTGAGGDLQADGRLDLLALRSESLDIGMAALDLQASKTGERIGVDLSGRTEGLRIDRLGPDRLGDPEIALAGSFEGSILDLERLDLEGPLLTLRTSGQVDTEQETASLDYRVDAPELGQIAEAYDQNATGRLAMEGRAEGPFEAIELSGNALLDALTFDDESYGQVALDHRATIGPEPFGRIELTASGSPVGPAEIATDFRLQGERLALTDMLARALGIALDGAVDVALDTSLLTGAVTLAAPDLSTLSDLAGTEIAGAMEGALDLSADGGQQHVAMDLTATSFSGFDAALQEALITGRIEDALGDAAVDVALRMTGLTHPEAQLTEATVEATLRDLAAAAEGEATYALTGIAAAEAEIASVTGTLTLRDALGDPFGALTAEIDDVAHPAGNVASASVKTDFEALQSRPAAVVDFALERIGLTDIGGIARVGGTVRGEDLVDAPTGELAVEVSALEASGFSVPQVTLSAGVAQEEGRMDATARLSALRATGDGVSIRDVTLDAAAQDALGEPVLEVTARTGIIEAEGAQLRAVQADVAGPLSGLQITASTEGEAAEKPVSARVAATADLADEAEQRITLSTLTAAWGEAEVALRRALTIAIAGQTTRVQGLDLAIPGGGLVADAALHADGLSGAGRLEMRDLAELERVAGTPLAAGRAGLDFRIDTRPGSARGDLQFTADDLRFDEALADLEALSVAFDGQWDGRQAGLDGTVTGPFDQPFRISAGLPLRPSGGPLPTVPENGALEGSLRWSGDIGELWALVPAPDHVLDGDADVDLAIAGTLNTPEIGGSVDLSGGQYQNLEVGTILTDLALTSELDGAGGIVLNLSARDGAEGQVGAEIAVTAEDIDATATIREAVLVRRDDVRAQITSDMTVRGPLTAPAVAGTVTIDRAEVRLVSATPPSVADLGDVRIKGEPEPEPAPAGGADIPLDIRIEAPGNVFVRGRGLDSEWQIAMQVAGTAATPRVTGAIERRRGRLDLLGRGFDLERGTIGFSGATPPDPSLDISLENERDGFIGRIQVVGQASAPEIRFTSEPQVPEEEVLPRALFGRSKQSLSPTEAIQLANAVATLLDGSGGTFDAVRGTAGIDVLRIDDTGDGVAVTVGKNVADGVFVGVKQPIDGGSSSIEVEVDVFEGVTVDGEFGQEAGTSIGFGWRRDF